MADHGKPEEFMTSEEEIIVAEAHDLIKQGIYIIPLHSIRKDGNCTCGRNGKNGKDLCDKPGKHPISSLLKHMYESGMIQEISWKQCPSIDQEMINYWFKLKSYANIGIPCTENDLVVLDFDNKPYEGGNQAMKDWTGITLYNFMLQKFPAAFDTPTVRTGSGGFHVYFRQPADRKIGTCKVIEPIFEIRSYGSYVVGPRSKHKSGNRYAYVDGKHFDTTPIKTIPPEILAFVQGFRQMDGRELPILDLETAQKFNYLGDYSIKSREAKVDMSLWDFPATPDHVIEANKWKNKYLENIKVHYRNDRAWSLACQLRDNKIPYPLGKTTMLTFVHQVNEISRAQPDYHPYSVNRGILQLINAYTSEPRDPANQKDQDKGKVTS